jgi:NADPH-dependent curcumin reductase CurA
LDEGLLKLQEDRVSWLENAPAALLRLLTGSIRGKVVVQISEE